MSIKLADANRKIGLMLFVCSVFSFLYLLLVWSSSSFPFQYDDIPNIIFNRAIRYWHFPKVFFETTYMKMRPVTNLSFAFDYDRAGLSVSQFRRSNFILHVLNIFAFGFFSLRLFEKYFWSAVLATFLFSLHPLLSETTVYISGRAILLATFFTLLALNVFLWECSTVWGKFLQWILFLFFAVLAFLSKENAAILPFLMILLRSQWLKGSLAKKSIFFLPLLLLLAIFLKAKQEYLTAAWSGYYRYHAEIYIFRFTDFLRLQLSLWPRIFSFFINPQSYSIDHAVVNPSSWLSFPVMMGIFIFTALPCFTLWFWQKNRLLAYAMAWIFLSLLPTNSIFPLPEPLAERHYYISLPGIALLVGAMLLPIRSLFMKRLFGGSILLLICFGAFFLHKRTQDWHSNASIWRAAYAKYPNQFRIVVNTGMGIRQTELKYKESLEIYVRYWKALPYGSLSYDDQDYILQLTALGALLVMHDDIVLTAQELHALFQDQPNARFWEELILLRLYSIKKDWHNFSLVLNRLERSQNDWDKWKGSIIGVDENFFQNQFLIAKAELCRAQQNWLQLENILNKILPESKKIVSPYWSLAVWLGEAYEHLGRKQKAAEEFYFVASRYKSFNQNVEPLWKKTAELYLELGNFSLAADAYAEILRNSPDDVEIRRAYSNSLRKSGTEKSEKNAVSQDLKRQYFEKAKAALSSEKELVTP